MEQYEVLSPVPARHVDGAEVAVRRPSSQSAIVGFVWHYGYRGDEMFTAIQDRFGADHPDAAFVDYEVFGNIHGAAENVLVQNIPARLREHGVTAVVAGVGG
jgi:hypothetical protein